MENMDNLCLEQSKDYWRCAGDGVWESRTLHPTQLGLLWLRRYTIHGSFSAPNSRMREVITVFGGERNVLFQVLDGRLREKPWSVSARKISWEKEYENYVAKMRQAWSPDTFFAIFSTSSRGLRLACTWPITFCYCTSIGHRFFAVFPRTCENYHKDTARVRGGLLVSHIEWSWCRFWGVWNLFHQMAHQYYVHMDLPSGIGKNNAFFRCAIWSSSGSQA